MQVIVVANQVGGITKSTSTREIALGLSEDGFNVGIVDACVSTNTTKWFGKDSDISKQITLLPEDYKFAKEDKFDFVLFDTGAGVLSSNKTLATQLAKKSHLTLIPVAMDRGLDENGFLDTMTILSNAQVPTSKIAPICTMQEHGKDKKDFEKIASGYSGIKLFESFIPKSDDVKAKHKRGEASTCPDVRLKVSNLVSEIIEHLGVSKRIAHAG